MPNMSNYPESTILYHRISVDRSVSHLGSTMLWVQWMELTLIAAHLQLIDMHHAIAKGGYLKTASHVSHLP